MGPLVLPAGQGWGPRHCLPSLTPAVVTLDIWSHITIVSDKLVTSSSHNGQRSKHSAARSKQPTLPAAADGTLPGWAGGPVRCLHSSTADSRARGYVTTWHSAYVSVLLSTGGVTNFDNDTVKADLLTFQSSHTSRIFAECTFKQVVSYAEIGILVYKTIAKVFHVERNPLKMLFYVKALVPCLLCMYPSQ